MPRENNNNTLTGYLTGEKIDEKEGFVYLINNGVFDKNEAITLKSGSKLTVQPDGYFELNSTGMRESVSEEEVTYVISDHEGNKMHGTLVLKYDEPKLANEASEKPKSPRNK